MSYNMSYKNAFVDANEMDYFQVIALYNKYGILCYQLLRRGKWQTESSILLKETKVELSRDWHVVFENFIYMVSFFFSTLYKLFIL